MKRLGVVVPVFNTEPYLAQCIESILNQSYMDFELVLVNDGSTDRSGAICDEYQKRDNRVHVIHQENMGKVLARLNGVKHLNCKYVTFVDADDWIDFNTYRKMEIYMEDDIDVISFQIIRYFDEEYQYVSHNHYQAGFYNREKIEKFIFPAMIFDDKKKECGLDPSLANKIIKKELLLDFLHRARNLKVSYGDDVAVVYPLMVHAKTLMITDESLYYHRKRKNETAPYFIDENFHKKLCDLHYYLKACMNSGYGFTKQLDYFFEISIKTYMKKYGDRKEESAYLFPFDKIPKDRKIILYGASKVGQTYYDQINRIHYAEVIAWVDKAYLSYENMGVKRVEVIETIKNYDYVVIAIRAFEIAEIVKSNLINMGVDEKKIVWSI